MAVPSDTTFSPLPTISYNTASIIKYRSFYKNGTSQITLEEEGVGTRFIISAIVTSGNIVTIGFGAGGTMTETMFTFSQAAGPLDLTRFFEAAPFCHYRPGKQLIIDLENGKTATVAYTPFKG
jgi:hypothetical protein